MGGASRQALTAPASSGGMHPGGGAKNPPPCRAPRMGCWARSWVRPPHWDRWPVRARRRRRVGFPSRMARPARRLRPAATDDRVQRPLHLHPSLGEEDLLCGRNRRGHPCEGGDRAGLQPKPERSRSAADGRQGSAGIAHHTRDVEDLAGARPTRLDPSGEVAAPAFNGSVVLWKRIAQNVFEPGNLERYDLATRSVTPIWFGRQLGVNYPSVGAATERSGATTTRTSRSSILPAPSRSSSSAGAKRIRTTSRARRSPGI